MKTDSFAARPITGPALMDPPSDALLCFARSKVRRTLMAHGMRGKDLQAEVDARLERAKQHSASAIATELLWALPDCDFHIC